MKYHNGRVYCVSFNCYMGVLLYPIHDCHRISKNHPDGVKIMINPDSFMQIKKKAIDILEAKTRRCHG